MTSLHRWLPTPSRDAVASTTGAALFSLALGVAMLALPLLAIEAGYSAAEVGALTAVSAAAQMAVRLVLGVVMRHWADWTLIAASALLLAASSVLVVISDALLPFVLAQALQGIARACFWTGSQTHVVRGPGPAVRALATVNFVASLGLLLGPLAAGVLSERSPALALTVAASVALVSVLPSLLLDRLPPFVPPEDRPPGRLWRRPEVAVGCWAGVTAGAWRGLLGSYIPVALTAARHSTSTIGALVSVASAASLVGSLAVRGLGKRGTHRAFVIGTLAAGIGTGAAAAVADNVVLSVIVLSLSGLGAGALQTIGPAMATDAVHPQERGEAIAAAGTFRAASLFAAPLGVAALIGVMALTPAMAVVGAAVAIPALVLRRRPGRTGGASEEDDA